MKMRKVRHKLIADSIFMVHALWIALLVGGTFYILANPAYIPYHLMVVTGTLLLNLLVGGCPLTGLEEKYRRAWDPATDSYDNSFVAAHLKRIAGIEMTPRQVNWAIFGIKAISYYISIHTLIIR